MRLCLLGTTSRQVIRSRRTDCLNIRWNIGHTCSLRGEIGLVTLVVEAVGDLVPHDDPDGAVVDVPAT